MLESNFWQDKFARSFVWEQFHTQIACFLEPCYGANICSLQAIDNSYKFETNYPTTMTAMSLESFYVCCWRIVWPCYLQARSGILPARPIFLYSKFRNLCRQPKVVNFHQFVYPIPHPDVHPRLSNKLHPNQIDVDKNDGGDPGRRRIAEILVENERKMEELDANHDNHDNDANANDESPADERTAHDDARLLHAATTRSWR